LFSLTGLTDILETQEEPEVRTPLLSPWAIVSDLEPETEDCKKCGKRKAVVPPREPGSPEIISETEPESD
jgi:hypothetical protein